MTAAILGKKIGMTRLFDDEGRNQPVTVIAAGPCFVSQVKTSEADGYEAVQLAFDDMKGRNASFPRIGHDGKAGLTPKRFHREFRLAEGQSAEYEPGQELTVELFEQVKFVDVVGTSKGKGFQGVMKRHGFGGQEASHGVERKHRSPGSISGRSSNLGTGKLKKGIRMAGRMGNNRVTVRSLPVIGIDKDKNLLLVKGPVPGAKQGLLLISEAKRLYKSKAQLAQAG
ncbi:MAG: 50S ribosomal protein L3 [Planctomycetes bacterium]|nr:50S ribosomal protein L3 [Planctomycetota bacterium]